MTRHSTYQWLEAIRDSRCPQCARRELIGGPWGGASRNLYCPRCMICWTAHGIRFGIAFVDCEGPITADQLHFARRRYGRQPWRFGDEAPPRRWTMQAMLKQLMRGRP